MVLRTKIFFRLYIRKKFAIRLCYGSKSISSNHSYLQYLLQNSASETDTDWANTIYAVQLRPLKALKSQGWNADVNPGLGSKPNLTMGDFKLVLKSDFTSEAWLLGNLELGSAMKIISLDYILCCRYQVNFEMTFCIYNWSYQI